MGKHAAADGSSVDPLIADALTHRPPDTVGAPRHGAQPSATGEGEVGWPGEPPADNGGLGWPRPATSIVDVAQESEDLTEVARQDDEPPAGNPPPPAPRRGWRRLLAFSA